RKTYTRIISILRADQRTFKFFSRRTARNYNSYTSISRVRRISMSPVFNSDTSNAEENGSCSLDQEDRSSNFWQLSPFVLTGPSS
ncbi:hypothetical protein L9F63_001424, partial [Diploptera punctata]